MLVTENGYRTAVIAVRMKVGKNMTPGKKRQLNYELLRIIAMLMIVSLHYLSKGGILGEPARVNMNATGYTAWLIEAFCIVAVNVYVLISGYFGVDARGSRKRLTFREVLRRPIKIWKQTFFYAMFFGCGALIIGAQKFDLYQFFSYCFPIVTEHYWFASSYIVLCLLMPFLNAGISYLDQRETRYLLLGFLLVFSVSKTVIPMQLPWDKYGYDSLWFVVLYLTGAYLRYYETCLSGKKWKAAALYFGSVAAIFFSFFLIRIIYLRTGSLEKMIQYGYTYNFFFCYTGAVGLFLLFAEGKKERSKAGTFLERFRRPIELFSGAAFGVYLIHEHINIRYAWPKWLHCEAQVDNSVLGFLGHMVFSVLALYLVCTVIEWIRQKGSRTILPALILLIYPLRHTWIGLDMMDAGYALGNYLFFDTLNPMWKLATYLANVTGVFLSKLPGGGCWIGMNLYCGLLVGAVAAWVYLFLWKHYAQRKQWMGTALFVAELTALSLCWAPVVVLYHYLGYLAMTVAVLVLYTAIRDGKKRNFIIAGVILGLCVAVRMPNITYMALILPVWCGCFWKRNNDKNWLHSLGVHTLYCIGGYLAGLLVPLTVITICYGVTAYPQMIVSLFGMTNQATDYKPTAMLLAMFGDYIQYSGWLLLFVGFMIMGMIAFYFVQKFERNQTLSPKVTHVLEIFYSFLFLVLLRFCYGRGMFDFNYTEYFSMYKWVTVYLLIVFCLCIWCLTNPKINQNLKLWAVFLPVIILITPLGSNNGLYPIINNLFLVFPVSILMMREAFRRGYRAGTIGFAFRFVLGMVLVCITVQSILFGINFVFHDTQAHSDGRQLELQCSDKGTGLYVTAEKATALEELDMYLYQNALNKKQVILYGDIPAIAYLFDMAPAIFTTWVDLDSNSIEILEEELHTLSNNRTTSSTPVIILGRTALENQTQIEKLALQKYELILQFARENGYRQCFQNKEYCVLVQSETK